MSWRSTPAVMIANLPEVSTKPIYQYLDQFSYRETTLIVLEIRAKNKLKIETRFRLNELLLTYPQFFVATDPESLAISKSSPE
jgi:hypothetical protein